MSFFFLSNTSFVKENKKISTNENSNA